jgi:hypothetical protein
LPRLDVYFARKSAFFSGFRSCSDFSTWHLPIFAISEHGYHRVPLFRILTGTLMEHALSCPTLLIERDKKGLQLPNIFPSQIKNFPIPDISIPQQIALADEIQAEMDIQNSGIKQILKKRKEIEKHVLNAIGISKQGNW